MSLNQKKLIRISYTEGLFHSLMVSCTEVYALVNFAQNHRDPMALGILSYLPQVLASLCMLYLPSKIKSAFLPQTIFISMGLQAIGIFTLYWSSINGSTIYLTLSGLCLYWLGGHSTSTFWPDWMSAKVGKIHFSDFISKRNAFTLYSQLTFFIVLSFCAGNTLSFPTLFLIGLMARLLSMALQMMLIKSKVENPIETNFSLPLTTQIPEFSDQKFWAFAITTGTFRLAVGLCSAFFLPYMLYELKLSTQEYVFLTAIPMLTKAYFLGRWAKSGKIFGHLWGIELSALGVALLPILWNLNSSFSYLIFMQIISGIFWGGHDISTSLLIQDMYHGKSRKPLGILQASYTLAGLFGGVIGAGFLKVFNSYHLLFSLSTATRFISASSMLALFNFYYGGEKLNLKNSRYYLITFLGARPHLDNGAQVIPEHLAVSDLKIKSPNLPPHNPDEKMEIERPNEHKNSLERQIS